MKFRKLRIAWSLACGILCLLLIVLWVRNYWRFDQFVRQWSNIEYIALTSAQGRVLLGWSNDPMLRQVFGPGWTRRQYSLSNWGEAENIAFFPASVSETSHPGIFPWLRFDRDFYIQQGTSYEVTLRIGCSRCHSPRSLQRPGFVGGSASALC